MKTKIDKKYIPAPRTRLIVYNKLLKFLKEEKEKQLTVKKLGAWFCLKLKKYSPNKVVEKYKTSECDVTYFHFYPELLDQKPKTNYKKYNGVTTPFWYSPRNIQKRIKVVDKAIKEVKKLIK